MRSPSQFTVLYTDRGDYSVDFNIEEPIYAEIGVTIVDARLDHNQLDRTAYARYLADADALITHRVPVDSEALAAAPKLKVAVRAGVGYENLDLAALAEAGVPGCNVPDYGSEEVAVHALSQIMALRRQILFFDQALRAGQWREQPGRRDIHRLSQQTAGVIGLGRIGREFAQRARSLFGEVLACDPYVQKEDFASLGVQSVSLDELLSRADAVTLHVPLTAETRHLISEREFRLMKPNAVLVNTSRGAVLDQIALAKALNEGWIEGGACDVWEREPPDAGHPLFSCTNFIASPHVAYYSEEGLEDMRRKQAQEVVRVLKGEPPRNRVS
jgi:D-3-phosphoglycerate dehydrogenase / 2-oxoglutarate reductase